MEEASVASAHGRLAMRRRERKQKLERNWGLRCRPLKMEGILAHMQWEETRRGCGAEDIRERYQ